MVATVMILNFLTGWVNSAVPDQIALIRVFQGSKCPSLPGFTHWVNPDKPELGFKPYFGKSGEYWVIKYFNVQMFRIVQIGGY